VYFINRWFLIALVIGKEVVKMGFIGRIMNKALTQYISNDGFNAGINGRPPRAFFPSEEDREIYENGYKIGLEASQAKLLSTISRGIEER